MSRHRLLKIVSGTFFIVILLLSGKGFSQQNTDNGFWTSFKVEKEFTNKWSASLEEEIRFKDNWSQADRFYFEIIGDYKVLPGFKVSLGYRLIEKVDLETYYVDYLRFCHRWLAEAQYKYRYNALTFSFKTRVESEMKYIYSSEKGKVAGWDWKNRLEVKYRLMRFEPYAGFELRYQFTDPRHPESNFLVNRIWIFAGVDFSVIKNHTLGVYYLLQREWNINDPMARNILGVKYSILIPAGKNKK